MVRVSWLSGKDFVIVFGVGQETFVPVTGDIGEGMH